MGSNEKEIREHVRGIIYKDRGDTVVVRDEFNGGIMSTRTDLAVFALDHIVFIEIKSDKDSLVRLQGQINDYTKYSDRMLLILDIKHKVKYLKDKEAGKFTGYYDTIIYDGGKLRELHSGRVINTLNHRLTRSTNRIIDLTSFLWHSEVKVLLSFIKGRSGYEARKLLRLVYGVSEMESVCKEVLFNRAKILDSGVKFNKFPGGTAEIENKDIKQIIFDRHRGKTPKDCVLEIIK